MREPNLNLPQEQQQQQLRPTKKTYAFCIMATLTIALGHAYYKELLTQTSAKEIMEILSNSFVVAAAVIGGIGALMWVASFGQFDSLAYACRWVIDRFTLRDLRKNVEKRESLYEYKLKKEEKRLYHTNPLLWVGLGALALGLLFLGVYYLL